MITVCLCLFAITTFYLAGYLALAVVRAPYGYGATLLVGIALSGAASQLLLIFGIFTIVAVFALAVFTWMLAAWYVATRLRAGWRPRWHIPSLAPHEWALVACVALAAFLYIFLNCVPLSANDAFYYHLHFVRDFILSHRINMPIENVSVINAGYFPALGEIIYAAAVSLSGLASLAPGVIAVQAAVFVAFLAALWTESEFFIKNRAVRGMLPLALMVMPVFRDSFLKAGMIDLLCNSLLVIGSLVLLRGLHKRGGSDLWVGAFLIGCAVTVKYMALIGAAYWVLYTLMLIAMRVAPKISSLVGAALLACVVPAYWYVRNALMLHNPVYPLFTGTGPETLIQLDNYLPQEWWANVLYPIIVYMPHLFGKGTGYSIFAESAIPLAAVLGTALLLYLNRRLDKNILALWGFVLFYSYTVSFIADEVRFDLPALITLTVLDGMLLEQLLPRVPVWAPRALAYAASVVFIIATPFMLSTYGPRFAVLEGRISPQAFIVEQSSHTRSVEAYNALVFLPER